MKKIATLLLAILMVLSSVMLTGCNRFDSLFNKVSGTPPTDSPNCTLPTTQSTITTTMSQENTTTKDNSPTSTTTPFEYITTATPTTTPTATPDPDQFGIDGVRYDDANNWNKVVDNVFTSDKGGFQMRADGWKTYKTYGASMVPEDYNYQGRANSILVALYFPEPTDEFASKTINDFYYIFQEDLDEVSSTTVSGYPAYRIVIDNSNVPGGGVNYSWVINTPNYLYVILFLQSEGKPSLHTVSEEMIKTVKIYK